MTYRSNQILVIYSLGYESRFCFVSDGNRCVIYTSYDPEMDVGFANGYTSFSLKEEKQERYKKVEVALEAYLNNEENVIGNDYVTYSDLKVAFIPNNKENQNIFDLGEEFAPQIRNEYLKHGKNYDYKVIAYLLAYFLPKELWPYKEEELGNEEQVKAKVESELLNIPEEKPITLPEEEYGIYPQDMVKDQSLIDELNKLIKDDSFIGYGYTASDYDGDYMLYFDIEYNGEKYRAVLIKEYRPNTYGDNIDRNGNSSQKANGFIKDKIYWFKFMPIKWYVIGNKYISKNVLDVGAMSKVMMHELGHDFDYENDSLILLWLNNEFKKVAFDSNDLLITILSMEEYRKYLPTKELRRPKPTDYALIKGFLNKSYHEWYGSFVWTSNYLPYNNRTMSIAFDGTIIDEYNENLGFITYVIGGIQPTFNK